MSKNIVDSILEYSKQHNTSFTFIPSRRQIDWKGGYVNNWTTKEFCEYVRSKDIPTISIQRDHGGPGQGDIDDDGLESFKTDAQYMDSIHIDPWKKYPIYEDALHYTIQFIQYLYSLNKSLFFEVGTEEGIRPISPECLEKFLSDLQERLAPEVFSQIRFVVIQCGTQLLERQNIGYFDEAKLEKMLSIVKSFNCIAKEHNGDWVSSDVVLRKASLGLSYINIAPELGELETKVILSFLTKNKEDFELFYQLCLASNRWKKWVSDDFNPELNKEKLILISGHYVFNHPLFISMKEKYVGIDASIREKITEKLMELNRIFTIRTSCFLCGDENLSCIFKKDKKIAISTAMLPAYSAGYFIPYNIQYCEECHSFQNKYLGNLHCVYKINHIDSFGIVKSSMHSFFGNFIAKNQDIQNTVEVGACHDVLSRILLEHNPSSDIYIIDPFFTGKKDGLNIIDKFLEETDLTKLNTNSIIMSSVFEHFYKPHDILKKLSEASNIDYIFLNHPDLDFAIKNDIHINLNVEHTFYIETEALIQLFEKYGFVLTRRDAFQTHTLCFEFSRRANSNKENTIIRQKDFLQVRNYFARLQKKVENINIFMKDNPSMKFYLWPTSTHLVPLLIQGLNTSRITALLDNSPNKIGKYLYGFNLVCESFQKVIHENDSNTCILLGGSPLYRNELALKNSSCKFLEL